MFTAPRSAETAFALFTLDLIICIFRDEIYCTGGKNMFS